MGTRTTPGERQMMYQRHVQGESYAKISEHYGCSVSCVRYWCRRQRKGEGCRQQGGSGSQASKRPLSRYAAVVGESILALRRAHPGWGPAAIGLALHQHQAGLREESVLTGVKLPAKLPSRASIGRYLHSWPEFRRGDKRPRRQQPAQPSRVHERWQIDFKLGIALADGMLVNLHTIRDEIGEACLLGRLTPAGTVGGPVQRVTVTELQQSFRQAFTIWGTLPEAIQTDNEPVFVGDTDDGLGNHFPGQFTLWLRGLGVQHITIRPGKPTDNAEVERCHQTICNYVISGQEHFTLTQLQAELDRCVQLLYTSFPSHADNCHGRPPLMAHPQLLDRPRPWRPELELALFDLHKVDLFLAQQTWHRRTGKTGQLCLGGWHHYYSLGRQSAQMEVSVRFDPADRTFVFFDPATLAANPSAPELCRRPARSLSVSDITGLPLADPAAPPQQLSFVCFTA
jgi:transposase InsO family protein